MTLTDTRPRLDPADLVPPTLVWTCASTAPGELAGPTDLEHAPIEWLPMTVPGTAAGALRDAGRWTLGDRHDFDAEDWWFRGAFGELPGDGWELHLKGVATIADVWVNGVHVHASTNMFRSATVAIDAHGRTANEVVIRCAALGPQLAQKRRPRPAWKARLAGDQSLRWFRTTLFGRSPHWTPDVAPVGPWRPVELRRTPDVAITSRRIVATLDGTDGRLDARFDLLLGGALAGATTADIDLLIGSHRTRLHTDRRGDRLLAAGHLVIPMVTPWWPATHGDPTRYEARLEARIDDRVEIVDLGRIGFRSVAFPQADAPQLTWNGVDLFCRGVCWTPLDPVTLDAAPDRLRSTLQLLRDAGCNVLRVQGSYVPESDEFLDLCDELGLLVWHDLPFAALAYPGDDPEFLEAVSAEVRELLERLAPHPSVAVICGGSEVFQQRALLGQASPGMPDPLFDDLLGELTADVLPGVPYWPNSPSSAADTFGVDQGIAHYFGVSGYLRPLSDARTSGVRFASECLAFSHVPGDETMALLERRGATPGTPAWQAGVPRDAGRAWDFEDVRDHYVRDRFGVDPTSLRATDPERYLDLGRAATAEVVRLTLGEWRREASVCTGALLLEASDLLPGAGFGVIDALGRPKPVLFTAAHALRSRALFLTDEGLNGLDLHAINDAATEVRGRLTVAAYAGRNQVAEGQSVCVVGPRSSHRVRVESLLGGFLDLTYAYRFGPRAIDAVAATWESDDGEIVRTVHIVEPAADLPEAGLSAEIRTLDEHSAELIIRTECTARCVLVSSAGALPSDDAFDLVPGTEARVRLTGSQPIRASVRAVNQRRPVLAKVIDA